MITERDLERMVEGLATEAVEKRVAEAQLRIEQERKQFRREFWINIFIGAALLFLAMICLEIVT